MIRNKLFQAALLAVAIVAQGLIAPAAGPAESRALPLGDQARRGDSAPSVFPGAAGFGIDTPAGRGGQVLKVTNLDADGAGSLRAAIEAKGPRIVVFEVGGVIDLGKSWINIREPFLTIAGQTAPSPGITIVRGSLYIDTHDVLIRHIAVRPGDAGGDTSGKWAPDAISTHGAHHVVIDHCSCTWAIDENLSSGGSRENDPARVTRDMTFSHCIVAEGLNKATHPEGPHSKGSLIMDFCKNIAIIGCLYAHNVERNPYFKPNTSGVVVNNLVYDPGRSAIRATDHPQVWTLPQPPESPTLSIVGNVVIKGLDSRANLGAVGDSAKVYMTDNLSMNIDGSPAPLTMGKIEALAERPIWPDDLKPLPAAAVAENVLAHAGMRPKDRDPIDRRIVQDVRDRKGRIIDSQEQVGGYPKYPPTRRPLEIPKDVEGWLAGLAAELD